MSERSSAEVIELVRQVRHDYLNHFQVVSGYLELGMPERAQAYINIINADSGRERELLSMQPAALALVLYQLYLHWRLQGIILEFVVPVINDEWLLACLGAQIEKLIMSQGWRAPDDDLVIQVKIEPVTGNSFLLTVFETNSNVSVHTVITRE